MPAQAERLRGVNTVGELGDPDDISWGRTQEDGARLQLNVSREQLFSAQALMAEDSGITRAEMSFIFSLIFAELQQWQRAWGIPDAQFAGDLEDTTPTEEVLTIDEDSMGAERKGLFCETPGPASTRRLEAPSCELADMGDIDFSKIAWQLTEVTYDVLNTDDGTGVLTITDGT